VRPVTRPARRPATSGTPAARRPWHGIGRRNRRTDDGFVLLESVMAIGLITVLMVALTALFVSAMQSTAHQRATQGAVRIATDEADQARGLSAAGALSGRDKTSVQRQFAQAPATVQPWLSTVGVQAFSTDAATGAGEIPCSAETIGTSCAALPTVPVTRTMSTIDYQVSFYQQWCHLDAADAAADTDTDDAVAGTPDCADTRVATDATLRQYLRVVVAIAWTDSSCPAGGCSYITSVMLSGDADPMFYFRNPPPPPPSVSGCQPQAGTVGQDVQLEIVGSGGLCGFSGGVPPITWAGSGLPPGLAVVAAGRIIGAPTQGGVFHVTLVATDAFLRTDSASFDWTVTYPPLQAQNPGPQTATVGAAITPLTLTATGGSGGAVFSVDSGTLPAGLTLAGNTITGTPTVTGTSTVTFLVTDATAGSTDTITVGWTVNPPPAVSPPPNTTVGLGGYFSARAVGSSGTAPYTYALQNAPEWMHIDPATGKISGTADSEIADYPGIIVLLTDSRGAIAQSAPFTWSVYNIPTMVPPGDKTSNFGEAVAWQLETTCPDGSCVFSATNLPTDWLTLDPATGLISGTAPANQQFFQNITVTITDASGFSASSQFNWVVGPAQTITSPGDQVWTVGVPLSIASSAGLQITADCSPAGPCAFSLPDPSHPLPPGLSMSSTGLITGTPTATGTWPGIVVRATPQAGASVDTAPFTWTINPKPTLDPPGNQRTVRGSSVSRQLTFSCQSQPCQITVTGLPAGLSIDASGNISGTATTAGTSIVTVNVTDTTGTVATRQFTWYVLDISIPDQTISKSGGNCKYDSQRTVNLAGYVSGYSDIASLTFTVTSPITTKFNGSLLTITAPCSVGNNTTKVTVTDSGGGATPLSVTATFTIKVV